VTRPGLRHSTALSAGAMSLYRLVSPVTKCGGVQLSSNWHRARYDARGQGDEAEREPWHMCLMRTRQPCDQTHTRGDLGRRRRGTRGRK
jgi:hypothetical protein